jgi:hypothetical protein
MDTIRVLGFKRTHIISGNSTWCGIRIKKHYKIVPTLTVPSCPLCLIMPFLERGRVNKAIRLLSGFKRDRYTRSQTITAWAMVAEQYINKYGTEAKREYIG